MVSRKVSFSVQKTDKAVVVTIGASRLGYEELESFGEQLLHVAQTYPGESIILDMAPLTTLSSIVIGKIFRARKLILESGGELHIVATNPAVLHVFDACQLDNIIGVFPSLEAALSSEC
jgi:anti-anti-sigma factor